MVRLTTMHHYIFFTIAFINHVLPHFCVWNCLYSATASTASTASMASMASMASVAATAAVPPWGACDATVEWHEERYQYPDHVLFAFVSEYHNSLSNIGTVVLGVNAVMLWHVVLQDMRLEYNPHRSIHIQACRDSIALIYLAGVLLALIGMGSFVFHATSRKWAQWCDEIPMVLFLQVLIEHLHLQISHPFNKHVHKVVWAIRGVVCVGMISYWYTGCYEIFTTIILGLAGTVVILLKWYIVKEKDCYDSLQQTRNASDETIQKCMSVQQQCYTIQQQCYTIAIVYIVVAKVAWELERHHGQWLPVNFHTVWHTLSALACYYAILACMLCHVKPSTEK